jgi:hypothetical protein
MLLLERTRESPYRFAQALQQFSKKRPAGQHDLAVGKNYCRFQHFKRRKYEGYGTAFFPE